MKLSDLEYCNKQLILKFITKHQEQLLYYQLKDQELQRVSAYYHIKWILYSYKQY